MYLSETQKRAWRMRRRQQLHRRPNHDWLEKDRFGEPSPIVGPITRMIDADPREAERLRRSRQQVREGEVHWGLEDDEADGQNGDTA
jgi:hypothetical protein